MPKSHPIQDVISLIRQHTVVQLPEIHKTLDPVSRGTVCRKLSQTDVQSSYSHRGRYYTLKELADFDTNGIWSYGDIHFSKEGSLTSTLIALIEKSETGFFSRDLQQIVKVDVLSTLSRLVSSKRISRTQIGERYLYVSNHGMRQRAQLRNRRMVPEKMNSDYDRALGEFLSVLDERLLRLFGGLESIRAGSGADEKIARILGMARATVTRGRKELLSGEFERNRVRRPGGGRKPSEKKL